MTTRKVFVNADDINHAQP